MKLGYNTGYWSAGPPAGVENVVAECDKLGFEHIWTAEALSLIHISEPTRR